MRLRLTTEDEKRIVRARLQSCRNGFPIHFISLRLQPLRDRQTSGAKAQQKTPVYSAWLKPCPDGGLGRSPFGAERLFSGEKP